MLSRVRIYSTQFARTYNKVRVVTSRTTPKLVRTFTLYPGSLQKYPDVGAQDVSDKESHSRRDPGIKIEYPEEKDIPDTKPVQGRGGKHFKKTLGTFSLEGKTCVVTGYVMCQGFIESGADVAIVDLNGTEAAKSAKELAEHYEQNKDKDERTPKITSHSCDVSNPERVDSTFTEIIAEHGKLDVLVTSAGFTENFKAEEYPYDRMKKLWGVNVDGTYLCSVAAGKHFMKTGNRNGSIIMVGSMSGSIVNVPQPQAPYNAAKAAVRSLAQSLAVEWAQHNIRVNCISPGYMLTALTKKILDENPSLKEQWLSLIPTGRMGDPVDLMGIVVYLASDASKYATGADFRIDGAYTCT